MKDLLKYFAFALPYRLEISNFRPVGDGLSIMLESVGNNEPCYIRHIVDSIEIDSFKTDPIMHHLQIMKNEMELKKGKETK